MGGRASSATMSFGEGHTAANCTHAEYSSRRGSSSTSILLLLPRASSAEALMRGEVLGLGWDAIAGLLM